MQLKIVAVEQNGPLAFGSLPKKAVRTRRKLPNVVLATSVYKQPTKLRTTTVSSLACVASAKRGGEVAEKGKKGKGKGAPAIIANVF